MLLIFNLLIIWRSLFSFREMMHFVSAQIRCLDLNTSKLIPLKKKKQHKNMTKLKTGFEIKPHSLNSFS